MVHLATHNLHIQIPLPYPLTRYDTTHCSFGECLNKYASWLTVDNGSMNDDKEL